VGFQFETARLVAGIARALDPDGEGVDEDEGGPRTVDEVQNGMKDEYEGISDTMLYSCAAE
jgi:hypothetical protein